MPASTAAKSRKWCFTMFWDGKEPGVDYFNDWECEYMYVGREICPDSKREHYQGYIRFPNPRALMGVRKLFTHTIKLPSGNQGYPGHWESCKGTEAQNVKYCSKDSDLVIEFGKSEAAAKPDKQQGKRNDIVAVRKMISEGAGMKDVVLHCNSYQGIKIAETMLKYVEAKRNWAPEVYWIYGPAGVNKSRSAFEACHDPWMSLEDSEWFEGYDAHEDVIIDDFDETWCKYKRFLRLTDRYPCRVPVKGASRQFLAKRIFITCDSPPDVIAKKWGCLRDNDLKQIGRRITQILYMPRPGEIYGLPGSEIGLEPSVATLFPERGPEQKVWGNTTDPAAPTYDNVDEGVGTGPALTRPQTGLSEAKCAVQHGPDVVCDDCDDDIVTEGAPPLPLSMPPALKCLHEEVFDDEKGNTLCCLCKAYGLIADDGCFDPFITSPQINARHEDDNNEGNEESCLCGFPINECAIVCQAQACQCFMEGPINEESEFGLVQIAQPLR